MSFEKRFFYKKNKYYRFKGKRKRKYSNQNTIPEIVILKIGDKLLKLERNSY